MLYNIFVAYHPLPNFKSILFSKFRGIWDRFGMSGFRALLSRMLETFYSKCHQKAFKLAVMHFFQILFWYEIGNPLSIQFKISKLSKNLKGIWKNWQCGSSIYLGANSIHWLLFYQENLCLDAWILNHKGTTFFTHTLHNLSAARGMATVLKGLLHSSLARGLD